jgi:hypothetical protein
MRFITLIHTLSLFYLLCSCAQQTSPTGGPQDTIPPSLIQSNPPHKTINFKGKTLQLIFDEDVIVNNPREQLLVTPSINGKVEMEARKKTILLNLNSDLRDSTTYTINFRESIQDVTEKNPAENLQLAFSTGTYLDSLTIKGTIFDLLSGAKVKDGTAALFLKSDTFNIFKHKPLYLTKSNKEGYFEFNNLKPQDYNIYTFNDKNKNLLVDSKTERYGFISSAIQLHPDSSFAFDIGIIPLDARQLKITSARPYNTYFNIKFSKYLRDYQIIPRIPEDSTKIDHIYGEDQTSLHLFFRTESMDSIPINLLARDTIGNVIDTTLYVKQTNRKVQPEKFAVTLENVLLVAEKKLLTATIRYNKPIKTLNLDSIVYEIDSTHTVSFQPADFTWNKTNPTQLNITKQLQTEQMPPQQEQNNNSMLTESQPPKEPLINKLHLKRGFFVSIDNDSSQQVNQSVNILTPENTGTIAFEISTAEKNYFIQILNAEGKILDVQYNTNTPVFKNLTPASYKARLIIDKNANQTWDAGNFFTHEEPEPIKYYLSDDEEPTTTINIKANWELGPLLITYP